MVLYDWNIELKQNPAAGTTILGENISDSGFCRRSSCFEFGMDLVSPSFRAGFCKKKQSSSHNTVFELIIRMELCDVKMNYLRRLVLLYAVVLFIVLHPRTLNVSICILVVRSCNLFFLK